MFLAESKDRADYYLKKIEEYMSRAETIKKTVEELKQQGKYHEQMCIKSDSIGHSYTKIFSRFLDSDVIYVTIEDPYIRAFHQVQNLIKFSEMLIKHCSNLKRIKLITTQSDSESEQHGHLNNLKRDLKDNFSIELLIEFSPTLHDRQISLSTGWIIKIGRGLDYFKAPRSKNCIGTYDLDLRPCHETTVDIFHSNNVVQK